MGKNLLIIVILAACAGLDCAGCSKSDSDKPGASTSGNTNPAPTSEGKTVPTDTAPKFSLTANQLQDEVKKNYAAASAKYNNVRIEISGDVTSVSNMALNTVVSVDGPPPAGASVNAFGGVQCVPIDPEPWATVCRFQPVKVTGLAKFRGGGIMIEEAKFVLDGPSIMVSTTAAELAAEYAKDADATNKRYSIKYDGKTLFITGPVLAKEMKSGEPSILVLGKDGASVTCNYSNDGADVDKVLGHINVGQNVKLVGKFNPNHSGKSPEIADCNLITK